MRRNLFRDRSAIFEQNSRDRLRPGNDYIVVTKPKAELVADRSEGA
jgi:hypothetical protein